MNNLKDQAADLEKPELVDADSVSLIKPSSTDHPLYPDIVNACKQVFDPEIPVNIYDLGLIYTIELIKKDRPQF